MTNLRIIVREACEGDIPGILAIAGEAVTQTWTHRFVQDRLGRDDSKLLVADCEGQVVGFASCRQVGDDGELLQIAVGCAQRRRGIGSLLLGAALDFAAKRGLASFFLEVRAGNEAAIALYKKHGLTQVRMRKNYYDNPSEDAVVMAKYFRHCGLDPQSPKVILESSL